MCNSRKTCMKLMKSIRDACDSRAEIYNNPPYFKEEFWDKLKAEIDI